jgi:hypothetical protein
VSSELARALLFGEFVTREGLESALFVASTHRVHLVRALLSTGTLDAETLDDVLGRAQAPVQRNVVPLADVAATLPAGMCARLLALPVRVDAFTTTVDVAMVDARDASAAEEFSFHLGVPVRPLRAPLAAFDEALLRLSAPRQTAAVRRSDNPGAAALWGIRAPGATGTPQAPRRPGETPPYGTPAVTHGSFAPGRTSDIPIPLTRRTFAPTPGGTQRPPPLERMFMSDRLPAPAQRPSGALLEGLGVSEAPRGSKGPTPSLRAAPSLPPRSLLSPVPLLSMIPGGPPTTIGAPELSDMSILPPDATYTLAGIRAARDKDAILELLLQGVRAVARRVAIFAVKRQGFVGWTCSADFGDRAAFQSVLVPVSAPSVLSAAARAGSYLGPIRHDDVHATLLRVMGHATRDVAAVQVRIGTHVGAVILADELSDTMMATRRMTDLAAAAGEALARAVREQR